MMKILVGHNQYKWHGGEDSVVAAEVALLRAQGHAVREFIVTNDGLAQSSCQNLWRAAANFFWSKDSHAQLLKILDEFKPDVAHFHNIYFILTPSVYSACQSRGVAVVQSLHNFRMLCANGLMYRDNHLCRECVEISPLAGIWHRCYRNSVVASSLVTALTVWHRFKKTFKNNIDGFITATEFTKKQYVAAGLAEDSIAVKSNVFFPDVSYEPPKGQYALYVGRLSHEKGIHVLLEAFKELPSVPLRIVGDGPMCKEVEEALKQHQLQHVIWLGKVNQADLNHLMREARVLVVPSTCYENFPRVVVEAYAFGLPVIAFAQGSFVDIVREGISGKLVNDINAQAYALAVRECYLSMTKDKHQQIRDFYQEYFSPRANYDSLVNIYRRAVAFKKSKFNEKSNCVDIK